MKPVLETGFIRHSVLEALGIGQLPATRTARLTRADEHLRSALIAGRQRPNVACE
jgi:hypothetical protein